MEAYKKGEINCKTGAKITECVQALDAGCGFKTLKVKGKTCTMKDSKSPLKPLFIAILKDSSLQYNLSIRNNKKHAMIDCVATTPVMFALSFNSQKIRKSFVLGGMIDYGSEMCQDVDQIIRVLLEVENTS